MRYALLTVKQCYELISSVEPPFRPQAEASQCLGGSVCARRSARGGKSGQSKLTRAMALTLLVYLLMYLDDPCIYCCDHYLRMYHFARNQISGADVYCSYLYRSWQRFLL